MVASLCILPQPSVWRSIKCDSYEKKKKNTCRISVDVQLRHHRSNSSLCHRWTAVSIGALNRRLLLKSISNSIWGDIVGDLLVYLGGQLLKCYVSIRPNISPQLSFNSVIYGSLWPRLSRRRFSIVSFCRIVYFYHVDKRTIYKNSRFGNTSAHGLKSNDYTLFRVGYIVLFLHYAYYFSSSNSLGHPVQTFYCIVLPSVFRNWLFHVEVESWWSSY